MLPLLDLVSTEVSASTKREPVLLGILTELAPSSLVINLYVAAGTAILASPSVTIQHLPVQLFIGLGVQLQTWPLRS